MSAFGSITALTSGTATLVKVVPEQFFHVQNNDNAPLLLTFKDASSNTLGQIVLNPGLISGNAGDYLDSVSYPLFLDAASVVLTSALTTCKFTSSASTRAPTYVAMTGVSGAPAR